MSPSTPAEHPTPRGPLKVYLSPDERAALQQLADEQDRSLSAILRLLLRRELSASAGNSTPTTAHDATRAPALDGPKAGFSICGALIGAAEEVPRSDCTADQYKHDGDDPKELPRVAALARWWWGEY